MSSRRLRADAAGAALRAIGRGARLAAAWTLIEWVRSWAFTGFPWNLIGSVWAFSDAMLQAAAVIGTYGLGLVTVAAAAMPAVLSQPAIGGRRGWPAMHRLRCPAVFFAAAGPPCLRSARSASSRRAAAAGAGQHPAEPEMAARAGRQHLLMQASMGAARLAGRRRRTSYGRKPRRRCFSLMTRERLSARAANSRRRRADPAGHLADPPPGVDLSRYGTACSSIDSRARRGRFYDKSHLVPFGEYMPLRSILGLGSVAGGSTDFSTGPGVQTMHCPGCRRVGPLICYEVIFPGAVTDRPDRPQWLLNLTNDGWYGISAGPYQHLWRRDCARSRKGLPMVRVANTGISAIIDPLGRIVAELGLGERASSMAPLPRPLGQLTLFAMTGVWGSMLLCLRIGVVAILRNRRQITLFGAAILRKNTFSEKKCCENARNLHIIMLRSSVGRVPSSGSQHDYSRRAARFANPRSGNE